MYTFEEQHEHDSEGNPQIYSQDSQTYSQSDSQQEFEQDSTLNKELKKLQGFPSLLETLLKNNESFHRYALQQFNKINEEEEERQGLIMYQCESGKKNASRNRYANILPYDRSRISLKDKRMGENDYINASLIAVPHGIPRYYIATQGPLRNTIIDFWRAVVDCHVSLIVCLTPETENELEKCARYWPEGEKEMTIQDGSAVVKVMNIKEETVCREAGCIIRNIRVRFYSHGQLIKQVVVTQLHFLGWPDHGVPDKPNKLVTLIKLARSYNQDNKPMLVHCSAGCGRTGAFCVIDSAERLIRIHQCTLDPIAHLTEEFRKHRTTLVQTQSQFNFCYVALLQLLNEQE